MTYPIFSQYITFGNINWTIVGIKRKIVPKTDIVINKRKNTCVNKVQRLFCHNRKFIITIVNRNDVQVESISEFIIFGNINVMIVQIN